MASVLVIQNCAVSPAGVIGERLLAAGLTLDIRRPLDGDDRLPDGPEGHAGVLILGGPMGVHDTDAYPAIHEELALVRRFHAAGRPMLGLCLGAQMMAQALGGRVGRHAVPEVGFHPLTPLAGAAEDPLLADLLPPPPVMQWHYDSFAPPPGATRLFSSALCAEQGFRMGPGQYALQSHPEVTAPIVRDWLAMFAHAADSRPPEVAAAADGLEAAMARHLDAAAAFGRALGDRWAVAIRQTQARAA